MQAAEESIRAEAAKVSPPEVRPAASVGSGSEAGRGVGAVQADTDLFGEMDIDLLDDTILAGFGDEAPPDDSDAGALEQWRAGCRSKVRKVAGVMPEFLAKRAKHVGRAGPHG